MKLKQEMPSKPGQSKAEAKASSMSQQAKSHKRDSSVRRRQFVRGLGSSLLLAPVLPYLGGPTPARAAGAGQSKRLVLFVTQGTHVPSWTPTGSSDTNIKFSAMNEPLAAIKDKIVIVEGLGGTHSGATHGSPHALTGRGNGSYWDKAPTRSIDQVVTDLVSKQGVSSAIPSLLLGADMDQEGSLFFRKNRLPTLNSVKQAFNVAFSGATTPSSGETPEQRLARKQSMLDVLTGDMAELSLRLGQVEKQKLDAHLASIRQLEERLKAQAEPQDPVVGCEQLMPPSESSDAVTTAQLHLDIIRQSLACDVTRVAGLMWGTDQKFTVNLPALGINDNHHDLQHSGNKRDHLVAFERFLAEQFAEFVNSLGTTPDPEGGMLLDNTMVVWARHMGDAVSHSSDDQRFVFAGAGLNTAAGGRYLRAAGEEYERGLHTIASAFGATDFSTIGEPGLTGAAKMPLEGVLG